MFSKLKSLLVAGAILPLAGGFAFAQSTQPTAPVANPPAATAPALSPSAVTGSPVIGSGVTGKNAVDAGAVKAGSTDTTTKQDKATAAKPVTKTAAVATKHHRVKKHPVVQKTDATVAGKTTAPAVTATPKTGASVPAKKL